MLTKFAVKNYRGFNDRIEWNLSNPSNYSFNSNAVKNGAVKNGIIYGPNGSGKSNFGLAIFDIANHLSHKWKKPVTKRTEVYMSEQMKESIEIHSLEELKKLIMEKDDNEILTVTVEVAADES